VVERVLGQGGFGITYLARDSNLDRVVAIKEYLPADAATRMPDATIRARTETCAPASGTLGTPVVLRAACKEP
jgi:serine/threonine protein kinase